MEMSENQNEIFTKIIKDSELKSLAADYAEIAVDGIIKEGTLKDIPLIGTLISVIKFGNSINKNILTKKIYKFLFELKNIPEEKRRKKIDEINNSLKYQINVGEIILELLDQIESDKKPEIVGRLFTAFLEEKIDFHTYLKATHIIKKIFIYDLIDLKSNYDGEWVHKGITNEIYTNGIVDVDYTITYEEAKADWDGIEYSDNKPTTKLTDIGKVIITLGLK